MVGKHIILDLYGCNKNDLENAALFERLLKEAALKADATILYSYFHEFGEASGITGVLVLAESHISVHTWNEFEYAAIDIFMCGNASPKEASNYIIEQLKPIKYEISILERG
jgi:S-adenosylmethionine decarboxylase